MLIDICTANPPYKVSQQKATEELKKRMAVKPAVARLIDAASIHSGIDNRFIVIPDADDGIKDKFYSRDGVYFQPDTRSRMVQYECWSEKLVTQAVGDLFSKNKISPISVKRLITISCTGFAAPGFDYHIIKEFNLSPGIKRTNIGFMGCAASIIGFTSVLESINSQQNNGQNILLVSVELCSLHLQTEASRDNILANMIFADGCAAALFSGSDELHPAAKLKLISTDSILFNNSSEFMGWKIGNTGFEMILSSDLPKIILNEAVPALLNILESAGINKNDIKHWALHPGGRAILDSLQQGLLLSDDEMLPSRTVLKNNGNMSSASILFVLKEILQSRSIQKNDLCCAAAFGPGLTMEVALFRGL